MLYRYNTCYIYNIYFTLYYIYIIYRKTFHTSEAKYIFISNAHGRISKINYMIGHKTKLKKFKKIEIISSICSDHKELKLEINFKEKIKNTKICRD